MDDARTPKLFKSESLRGYAYATHKRDDFECVYCGMDGKIWPNWLYLTWDHLLPPGHDERNNPDFIVTACSFCNVVHNRTRFDTDGKTPRELVAQKRPMVIARREQFREFWDAYVARPVQVDDETTIHD
jgi:hypothetical protein